MNDYPNFSEHGYQIETKLGTNETNGRITYKATEIATKRTVVIKEFQFDRVGSNWSGYDSFCAEREILAQLDHPSIPKYLDYFETNSGSCLVSEYKPGIPLTNIVEITPEEVKIIALELLQILIYLQQQPEAIVHRDIKPENILVNNNSGQLQVYLLDFGSATSIGSVSDEKIVRGTLGFMPPEQTLNLGLSLATDLYSLGVTLICLLTGTSSKDVGILIDDRYHIAFKSLLPQLNPQLVGWLEQMTEPKQERRFPNAVAAYSALSAIDPSYSLLLAPSRKQVTRGLAVVAFVAGVLSAFNALQYQCSFKSQNSSTSSIAIEPAPSDLSQHPVATPREFVVDDRDTLTGDFVPLNDLSSDACSQFSGSAEYQGFINDRSFIVTNNISCTDALNNCQFNAKQNPQANFRCIWNGVEIFSTRD